MTFTLITCNYTILVHYFWNFSKKFSSFWDIQECQWL